MRIETQTIKYSYSRLLKSECREEIEVSHISAKSIEAFWIKQIFPDIQLNVIKESLPDGHSNWRNLEFLLMIQIRGYTIGTIDLNRENHFTCLVPLLVNDLKCFSMKLFCRGTNHGGEEISYISMENALDKVTKGSFLVHFRGVKAKTRKEHRLGIPQKTSGDQKKPLPSHLSPLNYFGIQLLQDPETHEVYNPVSNRIIGTYNEKHAIIISKM